MFVYCLNNPVQFLDSYGQFATAYYDEARDRLNVFNDIGRGGGGHRSGSSAVGAAVAGAATGVVIGTVAVAAASTPKEKEEAKAEAIAATKTANNNAVYYGIDFFGGSMRPVTGPMTFSQADIWATATAASAQYSPRAAWGLYTKDPTDAFSMAIWLGLDPGVVRFDSPKSDRYLPHYHTADKSIHGIPAPSFHLWFG